MINLSKLWRLSARFQNIDCAPPTADSASSRAQLCLRKRDFEPRGILISSPRRNIQFIIIPPARLQNETNTSSNSCQLEKIRRGFREGASLLRLKGGDYTRHVVDNSRCN